MEETVVYHRNKKLDLDSLKNLDEYTCDRKLSLELSHQSVSFTITRIANKQNRYVQSPFDIDYYNDSVKPFEPKHNTPTLQDEIFRKIDDIVEMKYIVLSSNTNVVEQNVAHMKVSHETTIVFLGKGDYDSVMRNIVLINKLTV